tara:strand:- start:275 stop:2389 length:2115 start_codon:yes stop_codon:yes gene_type:complete
MGIIQQSLLARKETTQVVSSTTTNLNVQSLFGSSWGDSISKRLIINSGVSIGGTDLNKPAMDIPSGMAGDLNITNYGSILGAGGKGGEWTCNNGWQDSACTTRGGGRLLLGTTVAPDNEDGTYSSSDYVYGKPGAFLYDLNGNFIKKLNLPINNPSQRTGAYDICLAIGGDRMFVGVSQSYHASQTYWPSEGFHIYDLNGNLVSNGTAIRPGAATASWPSSMAANDSYLVVGDRGFGSCTFGGYCACNVYVYNHSGSLQASWRGSGVAANGTSGFGWDVDINAANDIVVGAPNESNNHGAVYYFPNFNTSGQVKINPPTAQNTTTGSYPNHYNPNSTFGRDVLIGKSTIMVTAPFTKHFNQHSPSSGSSQDMGEVSFFNFSGSLLSKKIPNFSGQSGYYGGYRFGLGIAKPMPEPASDEYWLAATASESGWAGFWRNAQYVAMYDSSFNQVGTFAAKNSYSVGIGGGYYQGNTGLAMTPAGSEFPRVFLAGSTTYVNKNQGSLMIFEHSNFRLAPTAKTMPTTASGGTELYDIGSPDATGTANQAGITTGKYLKWTYLMRGDDGGNAIRCNSSNVGINNQGTIYGGGGGGGSGCRQSDGKGGKGGNGQGYNQSQSNSPSSSIQQGGNGGTYGNDGAGGSGNGIGIVTNYGDRIRLGVFKYNHRKYNFKRSPIMTHDGGESGFIVTSTNYTPITFYNNGTRGGRL